MTAWVHSHGLRIAFGVWALIAATALPAGAVAGTPAKFLPSSTPAALRKTALTPVVLITGGIGLSSFPVGQNPAVLATAEVYEPKLGAFVPAGKMASHRDRHVAVELRDGRILIAGGINSLFVPLVQFSGPAMPSILRSTEQFDPMVGGFAEAAEMTTARDEATATLLKDGSVLIVGGGTDQAELYDPMQHKFAPTGTMTHSRYGQTATLLVDGRVLITGGGSAQAEIYDPSTGKFSVTGKMNGDRIYHSATLLEDGRVLIAGGSPYARSAALNTAELYDPVTGVFTSGSEMIEARAAQAATRLQDGRVLMTGGRGDRSAELYDPAADRWTAAQPMLVSRFNHSATLLADGRVLIAGGWSQSYKPLSDAEIYDPASGRFIPTGAMTEARADHTATLIWAKAAAVWLAPTPPAIASPAGKLTPTASAAPTAVATSRGAPAERASTPPPRSIEPTPNTRRSMSAGGNVSVVPTSRDSSSALDRASP